MTYLPPELRSTNTDLPLELRSKLKGDLSVVLLGYIQNLGIPSYTDRYHSWLSLEMLKGHSPSYFDRVSVLFKIVKERVQETKPIGSEQ